MSNTYEFSLLVHVINKIKFTNKNHALKYLLYSKNNTLNYQIIYSNLYNIINHNLLNKSIS